MIIVNGKEKDVKDGTSVSEFLKEEGFSITRIAVELNGEILPKSQYNETILHSGDVVEVVSFVGGG